MSYLKYLYAWLKQNNLHKELRRWWAGTCEEYENFSSMMKNALSCVNNTLIPESLEESILNGLRTFNEKDIENSRRIGL